MHRKLFVNLPVSELSRSIVFYRSLGFSFNEQFTDETAACMVISEHNYVMLLTREKFGSFVTKPIADAQRTTGVLLALAQDGKDAVNAMVDAAVRAGGREPRPATDHGFMFVRAFEDPDGHVWEPFWMDPAHVGASE